MRKNNENKRIKKYIKVNQKFISIDKKIKFIKINKEIKAELKKEKKARRNEYDRYIEHLQLTEVQIDKRAVNKVLSAEEIYLAKEGEREIVNAILQLPVPQNRRVYLFIVEELSLTEIAKIENRAIPVIKRSVDRGIKNLQEKLKKFLEEG